MRHGLKVRHHESGEHFAHERLLLCGRPRVRSDTRTPRKASLRVLQRIADLLPPVKVGDSVRLKTGHQVYRVTHVELSCGKWQVRGRYGCIQFFNNEDGIEKV